MALQESNGFISLREYLPEDSRFMEEMCFVATYQSNDRQDTPELPPTLSQAKNEEAFRLYLAEWGRRGDYGLIALADGVNVGAAWYRRYLKSPPYELTIAVRQEYQGNGIGKLLLSNLLEHAKQQGIQEMGLQVRADNVGARNLYEKLGFVVKGEVEEDVYTMVVPLSVDQ